VSAVAAGLCGLSWLVLETAVTVVEYVVPPRRFVKVRDETEALDVGVYFIPFKYIL